MLFDQVREQLVRLIPLFGVGEESSLILRSFDVLCGESLHLDSRRRTPELSRINTDGTPFQFSLDLSRGRPVPLQFLSEAGRPGSGIEERLRTSRAAIGKLADCLGVGEELETVTPLLDRLAPAHDPGLFANDAGVFWIALSVPPGGAPTLTIYINVRWGPDPSQWQRMNHLALCLDSADRWSTLVSLAGRRLSPLGMAVTLQPRSRPRGRIYLSAYGVELSLYRSLLVACSSDPCAAEAFDAFANAILAGDTQYPTRSAVFSVELPAGPSSGAKFELCAHCAFDHDAQAADRISSWLQQSGLDTEIYRATVSSLAAGRLLPDAPPPSLHAYIGIGTRASERYASIYLNPGASLETA